MSKFWELLEESVIVQALVTLALVGAVVYLSVTNQAIPEALLNLTLVAVGYYFGTKAQLSATQAARAAIKQLERKEQDRHVVQSN